MHPRFALGIGHDRRLAFQPASQTQIFIIESSISYPRVGPYMVQVFDIVLEIQIAPLTGLPGSIM
jgi:hypothetical protein